MPETDSIVIIIDDDLSFRGSTARLIDSAGFKVWTFDCAKSFLSAARPNVPACILLDVQIPGMNGLDLQKELARTGAGIPLIFMAGFADIRASVEAMKAGAFEFLAKPFSEQTLLEAIQKAIQQNRVERENCEKLAALRAHYDLLTPREREVMARVVSGFLNKQIAAELGIVEKTIKFHRAHIMKKMEARSLADLVKMAGNLERSHAVRA